MRVGIIGTGQLGWMMIIEGRKLGIEFNVLGSDRKAPASKVASYFYEDRDYRKFVDDSDVVTAEFEHVDPAALEYAQDMGKLFPNKESLDLKLERHLEKIYLKEHGIPVTNFHVANSAEEAIRISDEFDESILKTSKGGYDGKGQYRKKRGEKLKIDNNDQVFVVEEFFNYDFEASIIACRTKKGQIIAHRPSYNFNQDGILMYNYAPCDDFGMFEIAKKLMNSLDYTGVMGIEFFIRDGKATVNEYAPRVHNSGHHTLSGSSISQFEMHLRSILDLPLDTPRLFTHSGIVNIIGRGIDPGIMKQLLSISESKIYDYGKEPRPRRKLGHINLTAESLDELLQKISTAKKIIYPDSRIH